MARECREVLAGRSAALGTGQTLHDPNLLAAGRACFAKDAGQLEHFSKQHLQLSCD